MRTIQAPIALACAYLLAAPFSSFAGTAGAGNAVEASLQQATARAILAALSPVVFDAPDDQAPQNSPEQAKPPAAKPPSLPDLGFPPEQTQPNPQEQARLDKRSHMLKVHQRLGLITTAPLIATVLSGSFAGGKSTSSTTRDLHAALGSSTAILYFTTAYFSIFAPKVPGTPTRGSIRLHKALALIHGPGMILTPVLGAMAFQQKSQGEKVHGIASAHGAVGVVTAAAYGLAILSVSVRL
ncbi:MAG TPA: hypothetical protein VKR61_24860 [Bryobacteraceae bacterium]|nr:hypothetical protein [Bryobacteraceae bacterium]